MLKVPKKVQGPYDTLPHPFFLLKLTDMKSKHALQMRHRLSTNYSSSKDCQTFYNIPYFFLNFNVSPYCKGEQMGLKWVIPDVIHSFKANHKPFFFNYKDVLHPHTHREWKNKSKSLYIEAVNLCILKSRNLSE